VAAASIEQGALPIRALTPGATARVTADQLCAGRGPGKEPIAPEVRQAVLRDYGMEGLAEAEYELDYLDCRLQEILSHRSARGHPGASECGGSDAMIDAGLFAILPLPAGGNAWHSWFF
jgi:hypothetical protein